MPCEPIFILWFLLRCSLPYGCPLGKEGDTFNQSYAEGSNQSRYEGLRDDKEKEGREKVFKGSNQPQDRYDDHSLDGAEREDGTHLEQGAPRVKSIFDENGQEEDEGFREGVDTEDAAGEDVHHEPGEKGEESPWKWICRESEIEDHDEHEIRFGQLMGKARQYRCLEHKAEEDQASKAEISLHGVPLFPGKNTVLSAEVQVLK